MALKKCKECGKEVSSKAKNCPNCGAPIKKQISTGSGCLIIILFVLFIGWIFSSIFDTPSSTNWRTEDNSIAANVMMEKFVKERLRSPSTAKFPGALERLDHVQYLANQKYKIVSWVDAQNAFGATIRTHFSGEIKQVDKDNWQLVSLDLKEQ